MITYVCIGGSMVYVCVCMIVMRGREKVWLGQRERESERVGGEFYSNLYWMTVNKANTLQLGTKTTHNKRSQALKTQKKTAYKCSMWESSTIHNSNTTKSTQNARHMYSLTNNLFLFMVFFAFGNIRPKCAPIHIRCIADVGLWKSILYAINVRCLTGWM